MQDMPTAGEEPPQAGRNSKIFISAAKSVKEPTIMVGVATPGVTLGQTDGTGGVKL